MRTGIEIIQAILGDPSIKEILISERDNCGSCPNLKTVKEKLLPKLGKHTSKGNLLGAVSNPNGGIGFIFKVYRVPAYFRLASGKDFIIASDFFPDTTDFDGSTPVLIQRISSILGYR